jgi:hypothetical protein
MSLLPGDADPPGLFLGILLLAGTISVAGLATYALRNAGYGFLGTYVWTVCYGTALLVAWFAWLRDIELTGPAG